MKYSERIIQLDKYKTVMVYITRALLHLHHRILHMFMAMRLKGVYSHQIFIPAFAIQVISSRFSWITKVYNPAFHFIWRRKL